MPNEPAPALPAPEALPVAAFTPRDAFELAAREAKVYAGSTLVPETYRENPANCLIALNMAKRLGADILMTMQNLYVVHGNPGWSSKFLIACVNQCGRFSAMRYEFRGEEGSKDRACRAWAIEKATGDRLDGTWVTWKMIEAEGWAKKNGSKWITMPEQMFVYRAAAFWTRAYAPELTMGLQTVEELHDFIDVTPTAPSGPELSGVDRVKDQVRAALAPANTEAAADPPTMPANTETPEEPAKAASVTEQIRGGAKGEVIQTDRPTLPYATVRDQLDKATTFELLDQAAANIALVVNLTQQKELTALYKEYKAKGFG